MPTRTPCWTALQCLLLIFITITGTSVLSPDEVQAKKLRIAMVLWRGETPAEKGFKQELASLGYNADYLIVNAEQDRNTLRSKLEAKLMPQLKTFDYVYSFGTTASKMTSRLLRGQVPHLFNIVTDPVKAGIVKNLEKAGANSNGASHIVPLAAQIKAVQRLFSFKRLGLLFNPREQNAMIQRAQIKQLGDKLGFEVVDLRSPPAQFALERNLEKVVNIEIEVDAVYLPFDSFLISNAKLIGARLLAGKVKSIGASEAYIRGGALAGVVPDYEKVGASVAALLNRHQKGEKLADMPVQRIYHTVLPKLLINENTRKAIGLAVPDDIMKDAVIVN